MADVIPGSPASGDAQTVEKLQTELATTKKELEQAQHKIVEVKNDNDRLKGESKGISPEEAARLAAEAAEKVIAKAREEDNAELIDDEIASMSTDPAVREQIKSAYQTNIAKSGFSKKAIKADLQNARKLILGDKDSKTVQELKQTVASQNGRSNGSPASAQPEPAQNDVALPEMNASEKAWFDATMATGRFSKKKVVETLLKNRTKK